MATGNKGIIFNVQRYSIHDGPGIRTVVFLKGCPLSCKWCSNPESQLLKRQLSQNRSLCIGCLHCIEVCLQKAITLGSNGIEIDRSTCNDCFRCADVCAAGSLTAQGREVAVEELLPELLRDRSYFEQSDGGVTLSGGEPLMQHQFSAELLKALKEQGVHTAIETTGYASWQVLCEALRYSDTVLFDLKHLNNLKHNQGTSVDNLLILSNLRKIAKSSLQLIIRIPLIPGFNTDDESIQEFIHLIKSIGSPPVGLLPFHQLGSNKYGFMGKDYSFEGKPQMQPEEAEEIKQRFESAGLSAIVGG